ncbi:mechanosensitive ion channel family protein [Pasteuria penetrans]|uniref:mechanosensitive ion channel family protein n=1 Tax=Pasteuria penetrans TaxID=86005 RepID=UPI00165CD31A|nr:mechanosensitive ion channel family protein [Pasteuria penetrans]
MFQLNPRHNTSTSLTMQKLAHSVLRYFVWSFAIFLSLANLGIDTSPLLVGSGLIGIAIAFGAQNLVRDIITGFFIIFENQMAVGDHVEINEKIQGTVEEVGLRGITIREFNQRLHYIPNSIVKHIANSSRVQMRAVVVVYLNPRTNINSSLASIQEACDGVYARSGARFTEKPTVLGITAVAPDYIQVTITGLTTPDHVAETERELRRATLVALQQQPDALSHTANDNEKTGSLREGKSEMEGTPPSTTTGDTDKKTHFAITPPSEGA